MKLHEKVLGCAASVCMYIGSERSRPVQISAIYPRSRRRVARARAERERRDCDSPSRMGCVIPRGPPSPRRRRKKRKKINERKERRKKRDREGRLSSIINFASLCARVSVCVAHVTGCEASLPLYSQYCDSCVLLYDG